MTYNSHCKYQNCAGSCCNFYGDCPQWYSNGIQEYTNCYFYYGVNPPNVIGAIVGSILGILVIIAIICVCYKYQRRRMQQQLREHNENRGTHHKISDVTEITEAENNQPVQPNIQNYQLKSRNVQVYPNQRQEEHIFGIGKDYMS